MVRILLALCFVPFMAMATPTMQALFSQHGIQQPEAVIQQWEENSKGMICSYTAVIDDDQLVYKLTALDTDARMLFNLEFAAINGELIEETSRIYKDGDLEQLGAVNLMQDKQLSFSKLISLATDHKPGYLIEASLDHDLSISYIELKLLNANAQNIIAFDIENLQPLPLLKWN